MVKCNTLGSSSIPTANPCASGVAQGHGRGRCQARGEGGLGLLAYSSASARLAAGQQKIMDDEQLLRQLDDLLLQRSALRKKIEAAKCAEVHWSTVAELQKRSIQHLSEGHSTPSSPYASPSPLPMPQSHGMPSTASPGTSQQSSHGPRLPPRSRTNSSSSSSNNRSGSMPGRAKTVSRTAEMEADEAKSGKIDTAKHLTDLFTDGE